MARLAAVAPEEAEGQARALLRDLERSLGRAPNLARTLANSPTALAGYAALREAVERGGLETRLRELIALLMAEIHSAAYGVAMHRTLAKLAGLRERDLLAVAKGNASDERLAAALAFARAVVERGGEVTDREFDRLRLAGYTDTQIVDIVAAVALGTLESYVARVAMTEIDFPGD